MKEGQELVEAPETGIQPFDEYEAEIVQFEKYFAGKEYDLTTEEGKDLCEGDKLLLRKVEIRIDKTRKARGKNLRDAVTELNASAKVCHNRVHAMYEVIDAPLQVIRQAELNAEIDAREKEQAELQAIEDKRESDLKEREDKVKKAEEKQKAIDDAANAKVAETERQKELDEVRRIAAGEAEAQAAIDAEQAIEDAVMAERKKAHDEKNEREAQELAKKLEADARAADVEHRKEFNNLAVDAIVAINGHNVMSIEIVKAIVKGDIPNVTMNY